MTLPSLRLGAATPFRIFVGLICLVVAVVVIGGLMLAGSPADQRVRRFDETRVSDLRQLHYAIDSFYADRGVLPASLDEVKDPRYGAYRFVDPESGSTYEYQRLASTTYQLCANFSLSSVEVSDLNDPRLPKPLYLTDENFYHEAGRSCFSFNAAVSRLGSCGPDWSCAEGHECVSMPNVGQRCVPTGRACEFAGCAESCVVAESFPPQIRCTTGAESTTEEPSLGQTPPEDENTCAMYRPTKGGSVACYGCANGRCSKAPAGWELYTPAKDSIGIPYACFAGENGCELAQ